MEYNSDSSYCAFASRVLYKVLWSADHRTVKSIADSINQELYTPMKKLETFTIIFTGEITEEGSHVNRVMKSGGGERC